MLTERQQRFAEALARGDEGPLAAERAGYSPGRARRQAAELMKKPEVTAAAARLRREQEETAGGARIIRELARIAFADPAELLDRRCADPDAAPRGSGTGLKVKYTPKRTAEGETVMELAVEREVRVGDKLRALELLAKLQGLADPAADGPEGCGVVLLPEADAPAPPEETE